MDKKQIIHDIACAYLPIAYSQFIENGGNREDFDIIGTYKTTLHELQEDERYKNDAI